MEASKIEENVDDPVNTGEGFIVETKANGSKLYTCNQCEKEIKSEQGIKAHIASKHKKKNLKRGRLETTNIESSSSAPAEEKKLRLGSYTEEQSDAEFDFDPLNMHTTSQISEEHDEYISDKAIVPDNVKDLTMTVDEIVLYQQSIGSVGEAVNSDLLLAIPLNQEHNFALQKEQFEIHIQNLKATITNLELKLTEKNVIITKLEDECKIKDHANNILTAANNSLEDSKELLEKKNEAQGEKLKKFGAVFRDMLSNAKSSSGSKSSDNGKKVSDENDNLLKKQLKEAKTLLKKKDVSEKDIQMLLNDKNSKVANLETENTRLKLIIDQHRDMKRIAGDSSTKKESIKTKEDVSEKQINVTKCEFEDKGSCIKGSSCSNRHPRTTCQDYSKLGSCSHMNSCEHRHPNSICKRLRETGNCHYADRCRDRHPIELILSSISQSKRHVKYAYYNPFLGQGYNQEQE